MLDGVAPLAVEDLEDAALHRRRHGRARAPDRDKLALPCQLIVRRSFLLCRTSRRRLRIDSARSTSEAGSGHPTSCCSAADARRGAVLRRDAIRSEEPAPSGQRSLHPLEGARRAAAVCRVGRGRRVRSCRAAEAAADRLRPRRSPDAAAAVRRRGDRIARAGHLRGGRQRAERAPHQVRLPDLLPARRRRVRRRLGLGSGRDRVARQARQPVRHHRRERARPEPSDDVAARPGPVREPLARLRLACAS